MIRVSLRRSPDGGLSGFSCEGHAGYAEEGSDIVCAAVSALSITCANSLSAIAGIEPRVREKEGFLTVSVSPEQQCHDAQVILRVFEQGISDIAASYPNYIAITTW